MSCANLRGFDEKGLRLEMQIEERESGRVLGCRLNGVLGIDS